MNKMAAGQPRLGSLAVIMMTGFKSFLDCCPNTFQFLMNNKQMSSDHTGCMSIMIFNVNIYRT